MYLNIHLNTIIILIVASRRKDFFEQMYPCNSIFILMGFFFITVHFDILFVKKVLSVYR